MNRALRAAAALTILASGCASRGTVNRLQTEVAGLRSDLSDVRGSQEAAARQLARTLADLQALDARTRETQSSLRASAEDMTRLTKRIDAAEAALGETRARVDTLPPPAPAPPPAALVERPREPLAPRAVGPEQAYAAALATFRSLEHGQAVLDFLDFLAKYPRHPLAANAQYWIGEAYYAQRDYRQGLVEFQKVFEHGAGKAPDALVKIGLCYANLRDVSRARQTWQRVVREYPRSDAAATARSLLRTHAAARG